MATCPNGHEIPEGAHFCGERSAPLERNMVLCPKGHPNPEGYYFCEECGTPIAAPVAASTETKGALESSYPPASLTATVS
jgi:hypothetical protein